MFLRNLKHSIFDAVLLSIATERSYRDNHNIIAQPYTTVPLHLNNMIVFSFRLNCEQILSLNAVLRNQ